MKNCSRKKLTTVLTILPALGQCMRIRLTMQTISSYFLKRGSEGLFLTFPIGNSSVGLDYSKKEHLKISNIAKFGRELLQIVGNILLKILQCN